MSFNISLQPALPTDALALAQLHNKAFINDDVLELMYGPMEDNPPFASDLEQIIRDDTSAKLVKAVDESGQIVGWSWWSIYQDAETHTKAAQEAVERDTTPPSTSISPQAYLDYHGWKARMRKEWISGRPVAILEVLVVHPEYQRRGIGTMLLMAGVEEAHRLQLPGWLEASPAGYTMYKKCGFRDVGGASEMDLGKYGRTGLRQAYGMLMEKNSCQ